MADEILHHISDHPWDGWSVRAGGMQITLMSSGIATMILAGIIIALVVLLCSRGSGMVPRGGRNFLEVIVIFVRDRIAEPVLHEKTYAFLPFLTTMFVFVLGMNLIGLLPLAAISGLVGLGKTPIGGTPTGILTVAGGLALITLGAIVGSAFAIEARKYHERKHWPRWLCTVISPWLWVRGLCPEIPGAVGIIFFVPLTILELIGVFAKSFALMIRIFANMLAGHTLLAVLLALFSSALAAYMENNSYQALSALPACIAAGVFQCVLDLLVSFLQAYIFTFLTAMFMSIYVEPAH